MSSMKHFTEDIYLCPGNKEDFDLIYSFYQKDFPAQEQKDRATLLALLEKGVYKLLLLRPRLDPTILGYAFIYDLYPMQVLWLDYLAINPDFRSRGLGSYFLKSLLTRYNPQISGIFIEVEIPNHQDPAKVEVQKRRIRFYEKSRAKRIDAPYLFPSVHGAFPMYLYYISNLPLTTLSGSFVKQTLLSVFKNLHADLSDSNHILDLNLKALPDPVLLN